MTEEIKNAIKDSADLVVETMGFDMDEFGIEGIDAFIEKLQEKYKSSDEEFRNGIVFRLGSFLGETIIENYGGEWVNIDGSFAISFDEENENLVYVYSKVLKRFENEKEETVLSFYKQIPEVFKEYIDRKEK